MTKERLDEKNAAEVERWNRNNPIGTRVRVDAGDEVPYFGRDVPASTVTGAFIYTFRIDAICGGGARACVRVNSLPLPVPLEWCKP